MLTVKVKDAAGAEVESYITIQNAKAGLDGKRQRIASSSPQFTIPAGDYSLEAKVGGAVVTGEATVKVGEASEAILQAK